MSFITAIYGKRIKCVCVCASVFILSLRVLVFFISLKSVRLAAKKMRADLCLKTLSHMHPRNQCIKLVRPSPYLWTCV